MEVVWIVLSITGAIGVGMLIDSIIRFFDPPQFEHDGRCYVLDETPHGYERRQVRCRK